jgi:hypothetical protein
MSSLRAGRDAGTVEKGQFPEVPVQRILRQRAVPRASPCHGLHPQRPAVHVRPSFPQALHRARAARVRCVRHADRRSDPLPRAGLASLSTCEYSHDAGTDGFGPRPAVSVTGELAVIRAFVPLLRRAQGRIVLIEPAGARLIPPFAGPLTAMSAILRAELAPWHIDVTLTEPGAAARAITRALTAPRPRATSPSSWFGLYDVDPASSASLRANARARATARSVHKRCFLCVTSWLTHVRQDRRRCDVGSSV